MPSRVEGFSICPPSLVLSIVLASSDGALFVLVRNPTTQTTLANPGFSVPKFVEGSDLPSTLLTNQSVRRVIVGRLFGKPRS